MRPDHLSRRAVLGGAALGFGALAGCSQVSSLTDSPPRLGRVQVENRDDAAHAVHLLVERDGETVYWQTFDLAGTVENDQGETVRDVRIVPQSEWGDQRGDYAVSARLDHETDVTTDDVDHGAPCELLNVIVHGEPETASLSIINAPKDADCE